MLVYGIVSEDFTNYRGEGADGFPSLFVGMGMCDWKCCREAGVDKSICQNSPLAKAERIRINATDLFEKYVHDDTGALVVGGLEPFNDPESLKELLNVFNCNMTGFDFVIYTGYTEEEFDTWIDRNDNWKAFFNGMPNNIIIKFGRYIPGQKPHFDPVLGVELASDNQYAKVVHKCADRYKRNLKFPANRR